MPSRRAPPWGLCRSSRANQFSEAVISTEPSLTFVQVTESGPALMLSPSAQETLASPTPSVARPSWTPENVNFVPRISAEALSELRVAVHDLPEQDTLSELSEQPARAPRASATASARVVDEDMGRA